MDASAFRRTLIVCASSAVAALSASGFISTAASLGATIAPYGPAGLDNPRGLAFGPRGTLFVAEAGHGGTTECLPPAHGEEQCIGFTSGISAIWAKEGHRVLSGEFSVAGKEGVGATGLDGIAFDPNGSLFGVVTGSTDVIPSSAPGGSAAPHE